MGLGEEGPKLVSIWTNYPETGVISGILTGEGGEGLFAHGLLVRG